MSNRVPLVQELISGPFDADKLDYMQRDAFMAGVPAVTDVPRLVRKIRAIAVPQEKLPVELQKRVRGGEPFYVVFGVAFSGARTLDELLLGRILLFDKLYRHQKVRAAEGMVALLLLNLAELFRAPSFLLPYTVSDEQLLHLNEVLAYNEQFALEGDKAGKIFSVVCDLSRRLRERRLFVRAFAFARNMPGDPYRDDPGQRIGADKLVRDVAPEIKGEIAKLVADETLKILELLEKTEIIRQFPDETLISYTYIDPPQPPAHAGKISHAYLIADDGRIGRFREASTEMRSWTDAYLFAKDIGFIFCPHELKPYVFLAAEKLVRERYGVRSAPTMFDYIKQHPLIESERRVLNQLSYYSSSPHDLRPKPERLVRADIPQKFSAIRSNLRGYHGPYAGNGGETITADYLTDAHLEDWLRQFESESLISSALEALLKIRLLGRRDAVRAVKTFLDNNPDFKGGAAVPIGEIKDSGPSVAYFVGDVPGVELMDLDQALESKRAIIWVDDFIGSGNQASGIVQVLFGETPSAGLREARRTTLTTEQRQALRDSKIGFVFSAGWQDGAAKLRNATEKLGLASIIEIGLRDADLPTIHDGQCITDSGKRREFIDFCAEVANHILSDTKHDESWRRERVIGYGNRGLLITFPYNTPSQSLTCLWRGGNFRNLPWKPLLPRRQKK